MKPDFDFTVSKTPDAPPERALVFVLPDGVPGVYAKALFLAGYGPGIESDIDAGLNHDEVGPTAEAPKEVGLWIWDGTPIWREESSEGIYEGSVPEYHKRGTWRRPTPEEATRLAAGDVSLFVRAKVEEDSP